MAPITIYDITFGLYINSLESLKAILTKAKNHDPNQASTYPSARLHEDMHPLTFQVQQVSEIIQQAAQALAPAKASPEEWNMENNEATIDDLLVRVDKTLELARKIIPEDLARGEDKIMERELTPGFTFRSDGRGVALGLVLPNVIFHLVTAYGILRSRGVPLGKADYQGGFLMGYYMPAQVQE